MNNVSLLNAFGAGYIVLIVLGGLLLIGLTLLFCIVPIKAWMTALFEKAHISMGRLCSLKFRKINTMEIVKAYIMAKKANIGLTVDDIEALYLSECDTEKIITALMYARSSGIDADLELMKSLSLSGKDPMGMMERAVNPKVVELTAKGITQDNIEVIANAKITTKLNIKAVLQGPSLDTLISRVQRKIMSNIAIAPNHKVILMSPGKLATGIMEAKFDKGLSVMLQSVEINGVDIGRDIGAEMAAKKVQRDIANAQLDAEKAKQKMELKEIELRNKTEEMKAEVLAAEAEIPKAIADAVKEGRFSIMDYYKLMNLQADTAMRRSMTNRSDDDGGE